SIVFPKSVDLIKAKDLDLVSIRKKYLQNQFSKTKVLSNKDLMFLAEETNTDVNFVTEEAKKYDIKVEDAK
ncbi:MAG: hypothetical protein WC154_07385, partial [Candidatus Izemoplasmatales bacterium]